MPLLTKRCSGCGREARLQSSLGCSGLRVVFKDKAAIAAMSILFFFFSFRLPFGYLPPFFFSY